MSAYISYLLPPERLVPAVLRGPGSGGDQLRVGRRDECDRVAVQPRAQVDTPLASPDHTYHQYTANPSPVLVNVSAVCGLVMATLYCLLDTRATILSPEVVSITPTQWATFVGTPVIVEYVLYSGGCIERHRSGVII